MQELKTPMANSYREHPAFRFDAPNWALPEEMLAAFNEPYAALRQIGSTLDAKSLGALRQDCMQALQGIFVFMQAQSVDEFEKRFLAELQSECNRLLDEESTWYARQPQPGFVRLKEASARRAAIRMQADRHFFGRLPSSAVEELSGLAATELARFRANAASGKLKREDLSVSTGATVRAIRAVLNREFKALGVLDAVGAYTGRKTRVIGLSLELSVPQATWWKERHCGAGTPAPDALCAPGRNYFLPQVYRLSVRRN